MVTVPQSSPLFEDRSNIQFEGTRGLTVAKEHTLVESATTWERSKFDEVVREAIREAGEISWVVFPRIDRFARNIEAAAYYLGLLRKHSVRIAFAQENIAIDDSSQPDAPMNVLMFFLHGFKDDTDARQIRYNTREGHNKLAEIAKEVPNGMVIWPFDYLPKRIYGKKAHSSVACPVLRLSPHLGTPPWSRFLSTALLPSNCRRERGSRCCLDRSPASHLQLYPRGAQSPES
jgi:hypothetical protein